MRKVTRQAMCALNVEQSFNSKNTRVSGDTLYLFGNPIIRIVRNTRGYIEEYRLSMCGHGTNTTRDRLNGFSRYYWINRGPSFFQNKGRQYISEKTDTGFSAALEIDPSDVIVLDSGGKIVEIERHS